ncbi:MAG: HAD family phosphatase [Opitutales bacterium]|nr:HAD family phosphatase [Opitutales bacterium]
MEDLFYLNKHEFCLNTANTGMTRLETCTDGIHREGEKGVISILTTKDRKVEFINYDNHTIAWVNSALGYHAYYPVYPVRIEYPVEAVLMDLDGTTVRSEEFWIWIIQLSISSLIDDAKFSLEDDDIPYVSGHSVSEHLSYCIQKYCPDKSVEDAREHYFRHSKEQIQLILEGKGKQDAFVPTSGVKEFLLELKSLGIHIALVTSGLHEKAWPEIVDAFRTMQLGSPDEFYDTIITAGYPLQKGFSGTLGELSPKPHPWLYAEALRVGLGIPFHQRHHAIGIEDSAAGIVSITLAGISAIGLVGGNIEESGTSALCYKHCKDFDEILSVIKGQ